MSASAGQRGTTLQSKPPAWAEVQPAARLLILGMVLAAAATAEASLPVLRTSAPPISPAVTFGCCAVAILVLARWRVPFSLRSPGRALTRHVADVVHVVAVMLLPPVWLPAVALVSVPALLRRPWRLAPALFNLARTVLMLLAGASVLAAAGGRPSPVEVTGHPARVLLAAAATGGVMWAVSTAASVLVVWGEYGAWPRGVGLLSLPTAVCWAGEVSVGTLVAVLAGWSPPLVALAVPLLAVLRAQVQSVRAEHVSQLDAKTGLANAAFFRRCGDEELRAARRATDSLTIVMLDADHLREVNNERGHLAGDAVLLELAARLAAHIRDGDVLARFGGEEFAVLMPQTPLAEGRRVAERLRAAVAASPFRIDDGPPVSVTISGGVATYRRGGDLDDLIRRADAALYRAKAAGRDRVMVETAPAGPSGQLAPLT